MEGAQVEGSQGEGAQGEGDEGEGAEGKGAQVEGGANAASIRILCRSACFLSIRQFHSSSQQCSSSMFT